MTLVPPRLFRFEGGDSGAWRVVDARPIAGAPLPPVTHVSVAAGASSPTLPATAAWTLRGITSNERYVVRDEKAELVARQEALGRPAARAAALIPIRKTAAWWALTQDARREIFEAQSHHIGLGMKVLPAVARRLHHCRDLATDQPFDFVTWFEYAPDDVGAFDDLLAALRASPEWTYVDREVDLRLLRDER